MQDDYRHLHWINFPIWVLFSFIWRGGFGAGKYTTNIINLILWAMR